MENKPKHQGSLDKESLDKSLKILVKTSFIVFIGLVISKLLAYAYRIIIARYYGPEVYGLLSLAIFVSLFFVALAGVGLGDGILRFIPLYKGKNEAKKIRYLFKYSLITLTITGTIAFILLFFLSDYLSLNFFHNAKLSIYLKIISITILPLTLSMVYLGSFRAYEQISWHSFIFNVFQNISKLLFLIVFIFLGLKHLAVPLSYLFGIIAMFALSYLIWVKRIKPLIKAPDISLEEKKIIRREILSYSLPLLLFSLLSTIFYMIDSFSLGYYKDASIVGVYNAAVPIALLLGIAPEIFMQLFFPLITRNYSSNNFKLIEQLSKQVTKWIFIINIPILALIITFPGAVINLLFGSQYLIAEGALRILAISAFVSSIFIVSNNLVSMLGKSKLVLINIIIASTINLTLNSIFIPMQKIGFIENSSGLNGAALATLISVLILNLLFFFQAHYYAKIIPLRRKMWTVFLVGIISTLALFYVNELFPIKNLFLLGALVLAFLVTYFSLIIVSKSLDKNDWQIIVSLKDKLKELKR